MDAELPNNPDRPDEYGRLCPNCKVSNLSYPHPTNAKYTKCITCGYTILTPLPKKVSVPDKAIMEFMEKILKFGEE